MYPRDYFALFPAIPRRPQVFVAKSFAPEFEPRFREVIKPAIESAEFGGLRLAPNIVNARVVGDSILTEILDGIGNDVLFFADVSTIGYLPPHNMPVRNANVMYEVGIAHSIRRPEEVILFRSDTDALAFDIANVRINNYDPDSNPEAAKAHLTAALNSALKEFDLTKAHAVDAALAQLDMYSISMLLNAGSKEIRPQEPKTLGQFVSGEPTRGALRQLLDIGAMEAVLADALEAIAQQGGDLKLSGLLSYRLTNFGTALAKRLLRRFTSDRVPAELKQLVERLVAEGKLVRPTSADRS
jgi:hypothetical protein